MSVLVIAEHGHQALGPATRRVVSAALRIGGDVHVLVAGMDCTPAARQAAALQGVARVRMADAPHYAAQTAENLAALVMANAAGYSHILAAAGSVGKEVLPRVAALLDVDQVSEVCAVLSADTFVRPIYAGNALETVQSADPVKVLTVRASAFEPAGDGNEAEVEVIPAVPDAGLSELLASHTKGSDRPDLGVARIVVAGGRGLGSAENFARLLGPLADRLGAALGASYGAVSAGYVGNELQVGQTGKIGAPGLYIAVGIAGAIPHLAGIKDARVIVAINKDPEAPIFKLADYGLVADLFEAVPALLRELG